MIGIPHAAADNAMECGEVLNMVLTMESSRSSARTALPGSSGVQNTVAAGQRSTSGLPDDTIALVRYHDAVRLYVQQDANFNVTAVTDSAGVVLERYVYEAYGSFTVLNADWSADEDGQSDYGQLHLHQGGRYDAVSGLYHFRHRDYSPSLGRWVQQDPMGYVDGMSLYEYVRSAPEDLNDPFGLAAAITGLQGNTEHTEIAVDVWKYDRRCGTWEKAGVLKAGFNGWGHGNTQARAKANGVWGGLGSAAAIAVNKGIIDWDFTPATRRNNFNPWAKINVLRKSDGPREADQRLTAALSALIGLDKPSGGPNGETQLDKLIATNNTVIPNSVGGTGQWSLYSLLYGPKCWDFSAHYMAVYNQAPKPDGTLGFVLFNLSMVNIMTQSKLLDLFDEGSMGKTPAGSGTTEEPPHYWPEGL